MSRRRKPEEDDDDPKPLNFDEAERKGVSDRLKEPFMTPGEERGDNRDDQYYDEEEALSPEETQLRKEEDEDLSD